MPLQITKLHYLDLKHGFMQGSYKKLPYKECRDAVDKEILNHTALSQNSV